MIHHKTLAASLLFLGAVIAYYAFYQVGYAINSDNALMVEYARRWLNGGQMALDIYDPNPPGSFLIYLPVIYLAKFMPVWHALTFYTTLLVALSAWTIQKLLKNGGIESGLQIVVVSAYLLSNLALANVFYGERDHLIFLGLMPFVLLQYNLIFKTDVPKPLTWGVVAIGSALIMVKPHYILMPALMIFWRAYREKNIFSIWRADAISLLIAGGLYGALLVFAFPEYVKEILPAVTAFYAPDSDASRLAINVLIAFVAGLVWALSTTIKTEQRAHRFISFLMAFSICLLMASIGQLKGYYYHAVPLFISVSILVSVCVYQYLAQGSCLGRGAVPVTIGIMMIGILMLMPPAINYPTHESLKSTGINALYKKCPDTCDVFIFDEYPDIAVMAAVYNQAAFPSRFPSYWFLPDIVGKDKGDQAKAKYQAMVVEDFVRYKPDVIALVRTEVTLPEGQEVSFNFVKFFSENTDFARQIKHYKKDGVMELDRRDYHKGTSLDVENKEIFDLYRLERAD